MFDNIPTDYHVKLSKIMEPLNLSLLNPEVLGQALITFVAQNYGAKKMDRIIKGGKESLILGIIFSIIT